MAENLWALREQKRLSVATMASRAGLPIGLIMEYESGQRSIDPRHLGRIARALYVEESELRLHSDPRPGTPPLERQGRKEEARPAPPPRPIVTSEAPVQSAPRERTRGARPPRASSELRPPGPARTSQVAHLQTLLSRLGRSEESLEIQTGKPLAQLDRMEASRLIIQLQTEIKTSTAERHRPYLPEAVDQYECKYLTAARDEHARLAFKLFDNSSLTGEIVGFGPYSITVQQGDGSETTLNKLAIVSYTRLPTLAGYANGREPQQ